MEQDVNIQIQKLHQKAKDLLKTDLDEEEIVQEFKKCGIDPSYARLIIENVKSDVRDKTDLWKLIFMGSFFILGGLLLNYFSYSIAAKANSVFFYLFWGIIVTGITILIRAYFLYRK